MKNLEFNNPVNLNSIAIPYAMVSVREETSRSGKVIKYLLHIQDRVKVSNSFMIMLPISWVDNSDMMAIEQNIVRFVNSQIQLTEQPQGHALQLIRPPDRLKKIQICKIVKRLNLETIKSNTETQKVFCVIEVNFLGDPFNKWEITIHV